MSACLQVNTECIYGNLANAYSKCACPELGLLCCVMHRTNPVLHSALVYPAVPTCDLLWGSDMAPGTWAPMAATWP